MEATASDDDRPDDDETGHSPMRSATHTFASETAEIRRARQAVSASLRSWGAAPDPNTMLVVSELMTNAVRHGLGVVHVTVSIDDRRVRVEVHDQGAGLPAFREPETSGTGVGGFGLHLVDALAEDWGIEKGVGTRVWAETRRDPDAGLVEPPGAAMPAGAGFGAAMTMASSPPSGHAGSLAGPPAPAGGAEWDAGQFPPCRPLDGFGNPHRLV